MNAARHALPAIAVTVGDPAGIGPEVVLKALADPEVARRANWIIVGDGSVLDVYQIQPGPGTPLPRNARLLDLKWLDAWHLALGRVDAACGRAALEYIRAATRLCLEGQADAMVTAPVNKEAITLAGEPFTGHTEFIARLCGISGPCMLLVNDRLRVVHVSTHVPLRRACDLDTARILRTIELGHAAMLRMGIERPHIAVCGLNPHAGEGGLFGNDERAVIAPAVKAARDKGIACQGPLPGDTVFLKAARREYDLVVAMYHDQGHIPMKLLDFEHTVNVTLGLPIIRTSVDHGTAFDIVRKNQADPSSMKAAMQLAATMATRGRPRS